jgi:hypothetical protein
LTETVVVRRTERELREERGRERERVNINTGTWVEPWDLLKGTLHNGREREREVHGKQSTGARVGRVRGR